MSRARGIGRVVLGLFVSLISGTPVLLPPIELLSRGSSRRAAGRRGRTAGRCPEGNDRHPRVQRWRSTGQEGEAHAKLAT
jgi:hypothetical protein